MINVKPQIIIYNNLIKNLNKINAWTEKDCFPVKQIEDKKVIDNISVIEILFEGTHGDNSKFDKKVTDFNAFIKKFLLAQSFSIFFCKISRKELKNRIRSYKGILPTSIAKNDLLQIEYDIDNNYSIIVGLVKVSESNLEMLMGPLFDRTNNFIILTDNDNFFSKETIQNITNHILNQSTYVIDYLKLCLNYCQGNSIILRENGDGGDQEFTWQLFVEKGKENDLLAIIQHIILNVPIIRA